jgi:uncharacterized damage-inducible protein DinB
VRMKMDEILHLFGYNRWATGMMMDAADRLNLRTVNTCFSTESTV